MRPLLRAAFAAVLAISTSRFGELVAAEPPHARALNEHASTASAAPTPTAPCPPAALPDHGACVPIPDEPDDDAPKPEIYENEHHDKAGRLVRYEHIPRRPERPRDYRRYALPVPLPKTQALLESGYDLDLPDAEQRRGSRLKAVGHGGLDLAAPRGTPVHLVRLEHQIGDAEVLFVGELFGTTVVTRHSLAEGGETSDYIIVHGHLERAAADLRVGEARPLGATLGFVGDTGSAGAVHLHFEVRRVRQGVRLHELGARELVHNAKTIACDPRNVLELTP